MACASLVEPGCPIPRTHQRLEDAHRAWHSAADGYGDPATFRGRLNDTLKALRGGTWALQQETRAGHEFRDWHDAWHARIQHDDVLTWLLQAHRHSVSDDDLLPGSSAQVTLMAGPAGQALARFSVPPMVDPASIPSQLRASRMGDVVKDAQLMVLERRWAAADLQDWELLDALAHCYDALAAPLAEAHGVAEPEAPPPCLALSRRERMTIFRLKDGRVLPRPDAVGDELEGDRPLGNPATEKPDEASGADAKPDPLRRLAWYFEEARRALVREGELAERVSLFLPGREWVPAKLAPADLQDRYQLWARIAAEAERSGALAVMASFEIAPRRPGESARLVLAVETNDGQHRSISATFERRAGQLRFGRTRVDEDGRRWYFLDPLRQAWRRVQ